MGRSTVSTTLGALLAALVLVAVPGTAHALPGTCTSTWDGSFDTDWMQSANWSSGVPNGANAVACIPSVGPNLVDLGATVTVKAVHLDQFAELDIQAGGQLFTNGPEISQWAPDTLVDVSGGRLGGSGVIAAHGDVQFSSGAVLTSIDAAGGTSYAGTIGILAVMTDGTMRVDDGLALYTRYRVEVYGSASIESNSFIAGDWGTATAIGPAGALRINGDGGYYQGFPVAGQPLSDVGNHGLIAKDQGSGVSVIDAHYHQDPTGRIEVNCCGTLALPGATAVGGKVVQNMALATAACGPGITSVCQGSVNPAVDPMSVGLKIPSANPQASGVSLQELGVPPLTVDSKTIGNEAYAHADQLAVDPANPATLTLRYSQADVMSTPLDEVQVAHTDDAGHQTQIPDCISGTLPAGFPSCIVRPVTRDAQNTYVTVKTTQTSRWHLRRNKPGEPGDQTAPSAPEGASAKLAAPFDGSVVHLAWSAPTNDGGAAVSSYNVYLDSKLVATTAGTSFDVKNAGAGKHTMAVAAVNLIGASAPASFSITLAPLSKPRKVKDVRGSAGGKLTAGAKWKPPTAAGGLAITGYKVAVFKKNGKKVDTKVVAASKTKYLFKLKSGRYFFKVRARNSDRWGPWSKPTDLVRPR